MDTLAVGDPSAPTAEVSKWTTSGIGQLVQRVGPGVRGDAAFSAVDPSLGRPTTDEVIAGVDVQLTPAIRGRLIGVAKRTRNLFDFVNTGVPLSSYNVISIVDGRPPEHGGDVVLPFYNRLPSTFGRNQYLLTNPGQQAATSYALKFTAEGATERLFLLFGATASLAEGSAVNRGYGPLENDQDVAGELFNIRLPWLSKTRSVTFANPLTAWPSKKYLPALLTLKL